MGLNGRYAVGTKDLPGLYFREQSAICSHCSFDSSFRSGLIVSISALQRRSFVKHSQVVIVPPHRTKGASSGIRILERGNSRSVQNGFTIGNCACAHPAGQNRLSSQLPERFQPFAIEVGSVIPCGVTITRIPSLSVSALTISTVLTNRSVVASPSTSTGLFRLQYLGSNTFSFWKE